MKRIKNISILIALLISLLTACSTNGSNDQSNTIRLVELSAEQQEIIDLFTYSIHQEAMLFDFITKDIYRNLEVWVEVYENGKLVEKPVGVSKHNDEDTKLNGRIAIIFNQIDNTYNWSISVVVDRSASNHNGSSDIINDIGFGRAYGSIRNPVNIEANKEIIIYSATLQHTNVLHNAYSEQALQEQSELLEEFPYAYLIKVKFS
jgi:hypothetical protein